MKNIKILIGFQINLTKNADKHLKNFSLIIKDNKVTMTPFYDLINTTISLVDPADEIALLSRGKGTR